jgi:hypothetical protein
MAITNIGGEISAYYCAVVGLLCVVVPEIIVMKNVARSGVSGKECPLVSKIENVRGEA